METSMYEKVCAYIYKENIVREHLTGPQHYPDNGLVSGTRGEVSHNQEEEVSISSNDKEESLKTDSWKYDYRIWGKYTLGGGNVQLGPHFSKFSLEVLLTKKIKEILTFYLGNF
ncbi:hypothetical protein AVEN_59849-1 [Araneus ventricosus]|uniref:Uncharacterized protein n=1 Tax=Araneus ventricosus TaxID=182803 RepID=A0A4Y2MG14_ARAVE|nr:hypothetical protein AVEN_59849-1 [Araneus ventricosus]